MAGSEKGDSNEVDSKATKSSDATVEGSAPESRGTPVPATTADTAGTPVMEIDSESGAPPAADDGAVETLTEGETSEQKTTENEQQGAAGTSVEESDKQRPKSPEFSPVVEDVDFKVIFSKTKYDITFPLDDTVVQLKDHLQVITGVPREMQKLMIKGLAKDSQTLREAGITKGAKVMLVGSKLDDVLSISTPSKEELEEKSSTSVKEAFCKQKIHRKVLDKGVPDDVMPGILNTKEALPPYPLSGMLNKYGGKVRLTFKLELDQVWIGTKERTQKLSMNSIRGVVSEPIEGHEEYHILAMQLGPTEASRYWVYWVPVQYIDAIKEIIMGSWIM